MAAPTPPFKNRLPGKPTKRYLIVSDKEHKEICTIRKSYAQLTTGKFRYPRFVKNENRRWKMLKEISKPNDDWVEFTIEYIYYEAG